MNIINPLPMEREEGYEFSDLIRDEPENNDAWFLRKYITINKVRSSLLLHTSDKINNKVRKDNILLNSELPKVIVKRYNDYFVNMNVKIYCKSNTLELSSCPSASNLNESIKSPGHIHKKGSMSLHKCNKSSQLHKADKYKRGVLPKEAFDRSCDMLKSSMLTNIIESKDQINSNIKKAFIQLNKMSYKSKQLIGGEIEDPLLNKIKEMSKGWLKILCAKQTIKKNKARKRKTDLNIKPEDCLKLSPPSSPAQSRSPKIKASPQRFVKEETQTFNIIILSPCKKYSALSKYTNASSPKKGACTKRVKLPNSP